LKIHHGIANFHSSKPVILTSGTFDGVHLGHQKMLAKLIAEAKESNNESVLLTFYPHPRMFLHPDDHGLKLLSSPEEKYSLLEKMGIDHVVVQPFDDVFSSITAHRYIRDILVNQLGVKKIIAGYDHRFGKNREGNYDVLVETGAIFGFDVIQISAKELEDVKISSTKIRNALFNGEIDVAEKYLGRKYSIEGKVVEGKKLGSQLGFPTANINVDYDYKLIPKNGVYAVIAFVENQKIKGMLNIGTSPTVSNSNKVSIEVHLINWKGNIYDKTIRIEFVKRLRDEKKFESKPDLIKQLNLDKQDTLEIL